MLGARQLLAVSTLFAIGAAITASCERPTPPRQSQPRPATKDRAIAKRGSIPGPLSSLIAWDRASDEERATASRVVDDRVPSVAFRGFATVPVGGGTREVAQFHHLVSGLTFSLVPAGSFTMGSPPSEQLRHARLETAHRQTIAYPFLLSTTEVTQQALRRVMERADRLIRARRPYVPIHGVRVGVLHEFCRLAELRFPTEVEWEYACRGGTTSAYFFGESAKDLSRYAWFAENAEERPHPVGQKAPNPLYLFDILGNVAEICDNTVAPYESAEWRTPQAFPAMDVFRGGNYLSLGFQLRSASRDGTPISRSIGHAPIGYGLRPALSIPID